MKKIKELLKRVETALLKKPWVFQNLTRFRNYLTKILVAIEVFHLTADLEATIRSWSDDEVPEREKAIIRAIVDTVMKAIASELGIASHSPSSAGTGLTPKMKARLNLAVAKAVVTQLSPIIGVQPMKGPIGLAFMMQYKYDDVESELKNDDGTAPRAKKMTLEIISQAVEAASRKLQAGWTIEAMQDLRSAHKLDLEDELANLLSSEISGEIIAEVLNDLLKLGTTIDISEMKIVELSDSDVAAAAQSLQVEISKAASNIAFRTRRGAGNYAIVPPHALSILQALPNSRFKAAKVDTFKGPFDSNHLIYAGDLLDCVKVYVSLTIGDQIIVGYKGKNMEVDAGYYFLPYIPALNSGIIVNPMTFQPMINFMTRYGKAINGSSDNAQEYYRVIKLDPVKYNSVPAVS